VRQLERRWSFDGKIGGLGDFMDLVDFGPRRAGTAG
jgi:hypothetical protein